MDFGELRKCCENKNVEKLVDLELNKKYIITRVERKNTSVGVAVLTDLDVGFSTWLPKRFVDIFTEEAVKEFNEKYRNKVYLEVKEIKLIMGNRCAIINIDKIEEDK